MSQVQAYVYDVTQGMAKQMAPALIGKQLDLVPHTGIIVFGKEYFFGSGPCIGTPGQTVGMPPAQILQLGTTTKTCAELEAHIDAVLAKEHTSENYNLCTHNCNHYADDVAKFLLNGTGIPSSIVNIAEEALSTPQGQALRGMIEQMEASMRGQMGGQSAMNPFGNVGGAGAPAPQAPAPAAAPVAVNEELEAALSEISTENDVEAKRLCLSTLAKVTENVEKSPEDPKFRRIKSSNPAFAKKVATCAGGVEAMLAAGWLPDTADDGEDVWMLDDEAGRRQSLPRRRFAEELAKLPAAAPKAAPAAPAQPAGMPGGMGGMGGMGGGMPGGMGGMGGMGGGMPGGMPPGMANNPQLQQMMQNPAMMQQAQQMMQSNPQMMAQAQQMMQNPQQMQQMQQMMNDPQMMAQMQQMMGGAGRGGPPF